MKLFHHGRPSKCEGSLHAVVQQDPETHEKTLVQKAETMIQWLARGELEEMQTFLSDDFIVCFPGVEMIASEIAEETVKLAKAFPDAHFVVHEAILTEPNVVLIKVNWTGTHTGDDYAFGPYPPVPATGKQVSTDPEHITVTFKDTLIVRFEVKPMGPVTGWHGVYETIGGILF